MPFSLFSSREVIRPPSGSCRRVCRSWPLTLWLVVVLALTGLSAHGALKLWTGSSSGNFNNFNNWLPVGVPAAGDDLVFQPNNLVARLLVTNDFSPNRAFNSLAIHNLAADTPVKLSFNEVFDNRFAEAVEKK